MTTDNRRRAALVTCISLCSALILLGTFVPRPVMAQFAVKDNSNNTLLNVSEEGIISAYGAIYPGAAAIQSDNFLGFDAGTKELTLGATQLTNTLNMGNQLIRNTYAIEQASYPSGGWRLSEDGHIVASGLALSIDNDHRGALWFSTFGDTNLALYNNNSDLDRQGPWDGTKWNVLEGLNIRVGSGSDKTTAMFIKRVGNPGDVSGNIGIGTTDPQGALDVSSTKGGFIVPRMTEAQRDALTAVDGMIIYNTSVNKFNFYENGAWVAKVNE
jgi:hypothetical protein